MGSVYERIGELFMLPSLQLLLCNQTGEHQPPLRPSLRSPREAGQQKMVTEIEVVSEGALLNR